ncbi:F-box domain [Arabidopsis suecica]|uniref:F-box domain n=1 Tax=Arabidopsis suecica TaxID=45249 RepID=A0A8T2DJ78_ARASU|nr:F-box domain [Arabidopsis suecica]
MATMITNLRRHLIEEIISRVPLRSMKAVRLTCKSWNNISKSEIFTKMQIDKATTREGKTMMISVMPHNLSLMSVAVDDVDPSVEFKGQLSFLCNQVNIHKVIHCEGLLLCFLKDHTRVVVWNPYSGQTRWIKLRNPHPPSPSQWDWFKYALGYEDKGSCRSVKFLSCGVFLKGNAYWPIEKSSSEANIDHIICFDFTRESFGPPLPLPFGATDRGYSYVNLSCVKEEKLAVFFQNYFSYEYEFEIWVTTKIEAEMVSWSKFLRMDLGPNIDIPITFFIDEEKKVFMGFEHREYPKRFINIIGEAKYLRKLNLQVPEGQYCWPPLCSYVPSSIQIKKPALRQKDRAK